MLLLSGCGSETPSGARLPAEGDAPILQRVLDGTLAPQDGLTQVAQSAGWPIPTTEGYLFAVLDRGQGPYTLESPDARFASVPLKSESGVAWALMPLTSADGAVYQFVTNAGDATPDLMSRRFAYSGNQGGQGAAYADFVKRTVLPFVEAHYGHPARVGVMGSSLGGHISYFQKLRDPGTYDFVARLSGTFGWGSIGAGVHAPTVIEDFAALPACPGGTFYPDSGGGPGSGCVDSDGDGIQDDTPDSSDNYCENAQLRDTLQALGCGAQLTYRWASGAGHNEPSWRARAPDILAFFESL